MIKKRIVLWIKLLFLCTGLWIMYLGVLIINVEKLRGKIMKKVLFIATIFTLVAFNLFGFYGTVAGEEYMDFLIEENNQLRVRLNALGVQTGTETIPFFIGITNPFASGVLLDNVDDAEDLVAGTGISTGIGYKAEDFSIAVAYEFLYMSSDMSFHTPILLFNLQDDAIKVGIPITISTASGLEEGYSSVYTVPQIRYTIGLESIYEVRLYLKYGNVSYEDPLNSNNKINLQTFGFDARIYFAKVFEDLMIVPYIVLRYDTSLGVDATGILENISGFETWEASPGKIASSYQIRGGLFPSSSFVAGWKNPYRVGIAIPVAFIAGTDIVGLYLEPTISFTFVDGEKPEGTRQTSKYNLGYIVYGEITITPTPNLEFFFEAMIGGMTEAAYINMWHNTPSTTILAFTGGSGITWWF